MDTTLGKRIGTLRREKNLTQEDLARRLSVSPQAESAHRFFLKRSLKKRGRRKISLDI